MQCFDESRNENGITERIPEFRNCNIDRVIEIPIGFPWPDALLQLLPCYHLSWVFEKRDKHLERLLLQFDSNASLAELARAPINFIIPETDRGIAILTFSHLRPRSEPNGEKCPNYVRYQNIGS
jgi:hypothetical protein